MIHSPRFIAVLDACVLYPVPIRDLLLSLAAAGLYKPKWSALIQDEWSRNLLANRADLKALQLQRTATMMNLAFPDADVEGYEVFIPTLTLPDPDDRHVLAAAIHGETEWIVTQNVRDFPSEVLAPWGIRAVHPDAFLQELLLSHPSQVVEALRRGRHRYRSPPITAQEMLTSLARQGLPETVQALAALADQF